MSSENQPTNPIERIEHSNLIERFYNQPQIDEAQTKSNPQTEVAKVPLYECNLCERKYGKISAFG